MNLLTDLRIIFSGRLRAVPAVVAGEGVSWYPGAVLSLADVVRDVGRAVPAPSR